MTGGSLSVAYFLDRYPVLSQTFVTKEIEALRRRGVRIVTVAQQQGADAVDAKPDLLLTCLPNRGWEPRRAHLLAAARNPWRYARFRRRVSHVRSEIGVGEKQFDWRVLPEVARILRREQIEHLHAHFAWAGAAAAYCTAALLNVPWSLTVHANDVFSDRRNVSVKLASADRLVTVCRYNVAWLREHDRVSRHIDVVICGVDVPDVPGHDPSVDVVAVGRLVPKKGFDVLLEALGIALRTGREVTAEIVGTGPEQQRLMALAAEEGILGSVVFRGPLAHEDTLQRIARARLLCLPARIAVGGDRDSMPVVVKEAMARAVPVVATAVVAIPEMVDESVGRLVPPDRPDLLAAALLSVLDLPPAERASLGEAGRARVARMFTLDGEVGKLEAVFRDAVRAGPGARGAR